MNLLSRVLEDALRRLDHDQGLEARAVMLWPEVVGPQMAQASEVRSFRDACMVVSVRSSAWNQEFTFQKERILKRYRERLGKPVVRDLRFSVAPVRGVSPAAELTTAPEAEIRRIHLPDDELAAIRAASESADPELAQAVRRALTHEAQIRQWRLQHGAKACPRCGAAHRTVHNLCPACRHDDRTRDAR